MCHRSVGLLQNLVENAGVTTISIALDPSITSGVRAPRAAYLRFPLGNPIGEPFKAEQQRTILKSVLDTISKVSAPGGIYELPHRWRRF